VKGQKGKVLPSKPQYGSAYGVWAVSRLIEHKW